MCVGVVGEEHQQGQGRKLFIAIASFAGESGQCNARNNPSIVLLSPHPPVFACDFRL